MPVNPLLTQLADFIVERIAWIIDQWTHAVIRHPRIKAAENVSYEQLVDHLPYLLRDLAERLRETRQHETPKEAAHAQVHGTYRWQQGYGMAEIVREFGIIRAAVTGCVNDFARATPAFESNARAEAETVISRFFTNALADSAQQFEQEQHDAAEASQADRKAILDSALDCIIVIGEDGMVREWNPAAELLFGYSRAEAVGKELALLIVPPELRDRHRAGMRHYRETGEGPLLGRRIEVPAIRADGSSLLVELAITPHGKEKSVFTAYLRDITERVRSEKRRDAQYGIATLLSGDQPLDRTGAVILEKIAASGPWVFGALWLTSGDGRVVCHSTWCASDDQRAFEAKTRGLRLAPGEGLPARVIASGAPAWIADIAEEKNFARLDAARTARLHGALLFPLSAPTGIKGAIELLSDTVVTPDSDLIQLVDALGRQVGLYIERKATEIELHRQKEAAEEASRAKDRFLATLSHELRTPLNPVLMWACATSEQEDLSEEVRDGLKMICRNVEMEARLIDDLLDLTRIAQGKLQLNLQVCQADELLHHALEIVRSQFTGKRLQVSLALEATSHQIYADPTRIEQVFWNLLKNAQKFTPADGEIAVRSYDAGAGILAFEVSDNGGGIDPEMMPRLFTAFEQGARNPEGGLGLGLAICKAIVEMHGGKISAASRSKGASFTFELKTAKDAAREAPATASRPPAAARKLRILIVEDHEHTAVVMKRLLQQGGHLVYSAANVRDALDIVRTTELDLLVSDLGLPDGNGFQVMRELSKVGKAKGIAVSGYGMDEDLARSNQAGFSAHLTKPINVHELQETILQVTKD